MSDHTKETLIGAGREMALDMMESAVVTAKDNDQMNNQLRVLNAMSVHILATALFNRIKQFGDTREMAIRRFTVAIEREIDYIESDPGNITYSEAGKSPESVQ